MSSPLVGGAGAAASGLGALVNNAMAGEVLPFGGGQVATSPNSRTVQFTQHHSLRIGQAITHGDEIRFIAAILDQTTVHVSAPFGSPVMSGDAIGSADTFSLGSAMPSVAIFDYWDPVAAVQRALRGCGVDELRVSINGDFHSIEFHGIAADLMDSASFESGEGGTAQFPAEPQAEAFSYSVVPGHLGQIWIGADPTRFCTLTEGSVRLRNNLNERGDEFGCPLPKALVPGPRVVEVTFSIYERDDAGTAVLYQAARQRSPISLTLQLGQASGHLCGLYVPSFIPEVPEFDDGQNRLLWRFNSSRAQGVADDELFIAFG